MAMRLENLHFSNFDNLRLTRGQGHGRAVGTRQDMVMQAATAARRESAGEMPGWVPEAARNYLAHVAGGAPIRALAREAQVHASTILRQVRRLEQQRDDPLVDEALRSLAGSVSPTGTAEGGVMGMERHGIAAAGGLTEDRIRQEGLRVLRRLAESGTLLAVARDMEKGVVVREGADGSTHRIAVVDRDIAQAMALKEWIAAADPAARIARYGITAAGRAELRRMLAEDQGMAEAPARFAGAEPEDDRTLRHMRSILGDSPVTALARRIDRNGKPFLPRDLVAVAERLREDFELCHAGPRIAQDWSQFLTAGISAGAGGEQPRGAADARARLRAALTDLGPGLADVALRCCCFLEGLESIEDRMEWSARSGKIVLRIALQRLQRHYAETQGRFAPRIG